jgi:hypothetical protein
MSVISNGENKNTVSRKGPLTNYILLPAYYKLILQCLNNSSLALSLLQCIIGNMIA